MALTPMLKQYFDIKKKYSDCILFFRAGDFYEMFGEDAKAASQMLNITLTSRHKNSENAMPMCGVPYHALDNYLSKITKLGKKVAICEQISDPNLPGIVEREVVRVVTPGTTLDSNLLDIKKNNYLGCIIKDLDLYSLAFVDLTTGEFKAADFSDIAVLNNEISRLLPNEMLISEKLSEDISLYEFLKELTVINRYSLEPYINPYEFLQEHFGVNNLEGFGIEKMPASVRSSATLLSYLKETQKVNLEHINKIALYNTADYMLLDRSTIRNLDLLVNSYDGQEKMSLLGALDNTLTAMGARLLRSFILRPQINKNKIEKRLDGVDFFKNNYEVSESLKKILKQIGDLERIIGRLGCQSANPRDLIQLKNSLEQMPEIIKLLTNCGCGCIDDLINKLNECAEAKDLIARSIKPDAPILINTGGIIQKGYNQDLDELRSISTSGKDYIKNLQLQEIKSTGINTLKVKFNKVFGYYIEISKSNLSAVPDRYIRKQTLVNAERFITPELKEYEEKVLNAEEKIIKIEQELFKDIIEKIKPFFSKIQMDAKVIAHLDVFLNFAQAALMNSYCRPKINERGLIEIKNGRHPVIEKFNNKKDYIPNDAKLDDIDHQFLLITGPNMAGKSSFLRQNALIVLMAHIGSFVPAEYADIAITDRIFTRVGASDNLSQGQSTFMVEMQEAANILNNATGRSLIIIDELGRGTSTYDGVSLAWAIMEFIYGKIGAKTLFATHYHELIDVAEKLPKAQNYAMAVKEVEDGVVFLHKVIKGGVNRSYGIEVAKLAGMPKLVVNKALKYLLELETQKAKQSPQASFDFGNYNKNIKENRNQDIIDELMSLDLNSLTPIEAINFINDWKGRIK